LFPMQLMFRGFKWCTSQRSSNSHHDLTKVELKERGLIFYLTLTELGLDAFYDCFTFRDPCTRKSELHSIVSPIREEPLGQAKTFSRPGRSLGDSAPARSRAILVWVPGVRTFKACVIGKLSFADSKEVLRQSTHLRVIRASAIASSASTLCILSADCEGLLWQGGDYAAGPDGGSADRHGAKGAAAGL
jgi:hypothetical protein